MDYIVAVFFASFAALIYSVFTSFIASRSGRLIYRKIMWGYLTLMLVAAIVITILQVSPAVLAIGSLLTCIVAVVVELACAVKLGHLSMSDAPRGSSLDGPWRSYSATSKMIDNIRYGLNRGYHGENDPLRRW